MLSRLPYPVFRIADHVRADICNGPCLCLVQALLKTPRPSADRPLAKSERGPFLIRGWHQRRGDIHGKRSHGIKNTNSSNSTSKLRHKFKFYSQQSEWLTITLIRLKCNVSMRKSESEMAGLNRLPLILTAKQQQTSPQFFTLETFRSFHNGTCAIAM
jgi:hypothetical protein